MLLNCHLAAFHSGFKKQPNDNLITFVVCEADPNPQRCLSIEDEMSPWKGSGELPMPILSGESTDFRVLKWFIEVMIRVLSCDK